MIYYSYDAQSRRISKQIDSAPVTSYVYDGWNMIADYFNLNSSFTIRNSYTWGMDLSGSMQGAGGVGGLLQVTDHETLTTDHYYPTYDGNGNVSEYLDGTGSTVTQSLIDSTKIQTFTRTLQQNEDALGLFDDRYSSMPGDSNRACCYRRYCW